MQTLDSLITRLNNGSVNALAELYGNDQAVLQIQTERYHNLLNKFRSLFPASEVEVFSSPGRTEIGGNHTDHNYGRVLAGAVNLDNIAVAAPNNSNKVRLQSMGYPKFEVDLNNLKPDSSEFYTSGSLIRGICAQPST